MKQLQEDIRDFFNENERFNKMQKIISAKLIHSSESYVRTDKVNVLNIATKNCQLLTPPQSANTVVYSVVS